MSYLQRETPSGETRGFEGNKSSINNSSAELRQLIIDSARFYLNLLQDWQTQCGFNKHLSQDTTRKIFLENISSEARRKNPFGFAETPEIAYRAIQSSYWKTRNVIEGLHSYFESRNLRGGL